jgi:hypothetical protein
MMTGHTVIIATPPHAIQQFEILLKIEMGVLRAAQWNIN